MTGIHVRELMENRFFPRFLLHFIEVVFRSGHRYGPGVPVSCDLFGYLKRDSCSVSPVAAGSAIRPPRIWVLLDISRPFGRSVRKHHRSGHGIRHSFPYGRRRLHPLDNQFLNHITRWIDSRILQHAPRQQSIKRARSL